MRNVTLTEQEWVTVVQCMAYAPARECVALMNKIGQQLNQQAVETANASGRDNGHHVNSGTDRPVGRDGVGDH
jgi:hypothetical protein